MTRIDCLNKAREIHLKAIRQVLRERRETDPRAVSEVLIEANSEALDGIYRLVRPDILYRDDQGTVCLDRVNEEDYLSFEPFSLRPAAGIEFRWAPFHWYQLEVRVVGDIRGWAAFERWAHHWLDADDARIVEGQEWANAIHEVTKPELADGTWNFTIDLGSAEVPCIDELTSVLVEQGAVTVEMGREGALAGARL
jgi:hypothetical protein